VKRSEITAQLLASGARSNYLGRKDVLAKLLRITGKLIFNLFLGEDLWGATTLVSLVVYVVLVVIGRGHSNVMAKWLFAFVSGTLAVTIIAKFGDGLSQPGSLDGFVRIGWGDCLSRMSVYLIPALLCVFLGRGEHVWLKFEPKKQKERAKSVTSPSQKRA
jgi:hypothetical protein